MGWRIQRINHELRKYDRRLYAAQNPGSETIMILRRPDRLAASDFNQVLPDASTQSVQFIIALTDNWQLSGKPIEMGLDPLMRRLQELDSWRDHTITDRMRKGREQERENKERAKRNDIRAIAADMRKEFAVATNDINTSSLAKIDQRRMKYGSCK